MIQLFEYLINDRLHESGSITDKKTRWIYRFVGFLCYHKAVRFQCAFAVSYILHIINKWYMVNMLNRVINQLSHLCFLWFFSPCQQIYTYIRLFVLQNFRLFCLKFLQMISSLDNNIVNLYIVPAARQTPKHVIISTEIVSICV